MQKRTATLKTSIPENKNFNNQRNVLWNIKEHHCQLMHSSMTISMNERRTLTRRLDKKKTFLYTSKCYLLCCLNTHDKDKIENSEVKFELYQH